MNKNAMKVIDVVLLGCIALLSISVLLSSMLIVFSEKELVFDFTSAGFSFFLTLYSFPIKLLSAAVAVFSIWAVVKNIHRTRLAFIYGQLTNELFRCEDEIKDILAKKIAPKDVIVVLQNKLSHHANLGAACDYFSRCANPELSIDEFISHLTKLGIKESDGVYRTMTQNLTLRLTRYSLALLELSEMSEDKMFVKYYANKYISLMIDLHHYKAEMDINLVHICFQLSSVQASFDYDFKKINGAGHILIAKEFQKLVETQKV
ncbi:hypothetical protein FM038_024660 [Shewanella eurypsychrophilus]|uniref:Uncharacterized protein n=1 Tax=Shewanella eurypsychrophilus TaxID=2593656 RepID=A0ABX6VJE4_9GAMM|nr:MULTISPECIES: hypothetical protein [Shewanella]QFU24997.1 hypothetical protein FS418_26285 [Shewanella sp. YLB-09]QPG60173.1 hypothetical protein FM038_024660 [Shewanella eurypsychrophilus]